MQEAERVKDLKFPQMADTAQDSESLGIAAGVHSRSWIDDRSAPPRRWPVSAALLIAWGASQTRASILSIVIFFLSWAALVLATGSSGLAWVGTAGVVSAMLAMGYSLYAHARNTQTDDTASLSNGWSLDKTSVN